MLLWRALGGAMAPRRGDEADDGVRLGALTEIIDATSDTSLSAGSVHAGRSGGEKDRKRCTQGRRAGVGECGTTGARMVVCGSVVHGRCVVEEYPGSQGVSQGIRCQLGDSLRGEHDAPSSLASCELSGSRPRRPSTRPSARLCRLGCALIVVDIMAVACSLGGGGRRAREVEGGRESSTWGLGPYRVRRGLE